MFRNRLAHTRTLLCSLAVLTVALVGAGTVLASNPGVAPVLVPYTITAIAGNTQTIVPGYGGDGVPALSTTMNGAQSSMPVLAASTYPTRSRASGVSWMLGIVRFGGIVGAMGGGILLNAGYKMAAIVLMIVNFWFGPEARDRNFFREPT